MKQQLDRIQTKKGGEFRRLKAKSQKALQISTQSVDLNQALKSAYQKADKLNKLKSTNAKDDKVITKAKNEVADQIVRLKKKVR